MKLRYEFRVYPTEGQKAKLEKVFGCCRYVYNRALEYRSVSWKDKKERVNYSRTSAELTKWKREEDTKWLQDVSSVALQQSLRHLDSAFSGFFTKKSKYPVFKKKSNKQSAEFTKSAFKFSKPDPNNPKLVVAKLGKLKVRWSRKFFSDPTTVTIVKRPSGRYYVTLVVDKEFSKLENTGKVVGIDLGINRFATLSDGSSVANPRFSSKNQTRLARAQRILSRRTKGSNRWNRQRIRVAKIHEKISDSRKDFLNKVTTGLVREYDQICIEDLDVKSMVETNRLDSSGKTKRFSALISDVSFGEFRRMLEYKCEKFGRQLKVVDRFFPSSKKCSECGFVLDKLPLNIREWDCPECGQHHDRDKNAAKNILVAGLGQFNRSTPEEQSSLVAELAGGHPVNARGGNVRHLEPSGSACGSRRNVNRTIKIGIPIL